jgi:hypothetical protein
MLAGISDPRNVGKFSRASLAEQLRSRTADWEPPRMDLKLRPGDLDD